ncbi:hypothetical protein BT96DRAFT_999400 [Gymnopus androsaceus JB14]|uniref:Uncharacterized protein n=1 Tax=Gymnopus androsaceus JB14 TaxID=1447944 RepID=A0A6A4H8K9_9AGAR|nr:hypothetical protein BT96DRAFT_999400 [Gymnopus androsaceus JB14]
MPKVATPRTPNLRSHVTPNPATKTAQRRANRDNIQQLLYNIRRTAGLTKSFRRPVLGNGEYAKFKPLVFTGDTDNFNSSDHPHFADLGRLYYPVLRSNQLFRLIWEPQWIPLCHLQASDELLSLLLACELLRAIPRTGSKSKEKEGSSSLTSAASVSHSNTNPSSRSSNSVASSSRDRRSAMTTLVISDDDGDSNIEIVDVSNVLMRRATLSSLPADSSPAPKCKLLRDATSNAQRDRFIAEAMSSSPVSSDKDEVEQHLRTKAVAQTSVTLYVFTDTKSDLCPIDVKLGIAPGSFISLGAYLEKQLVGLKSARSIDRYIAVTGVWREIKWNTPFVVRNGSIIALKPSNVTLKDWHIHAPHIFNN